jgi:hypothetical protein
VWKMQSSKIHWRHTRVPASFQEEENGVMSLSESLLVAKKEEAPFTILEF